jgi:hypothetical protein
LQALKLQLLARGLLDHLVGKRPAAEAGGNPPHRRPTRRLKVNPSYAAVTLRHSPFADARPDAEGRWTVYVPLPIDTQGRGARHLPWPLSTLRAARGVGLGELVGKLGAFGGLPAPVFLSAKIGGRRESYARGAVAASVRGVSVLGASARSRYATHPL